MESRLPFPPKRAWDFRGFTTVNHSSGCKLGSVAILNHLSRFSVYCKVAGTGSTVLSIKSEERDGYSSKKYYYCTVESMYCSLLKG
jgi:hypothetical protein